MHESHDEGGFGIRSPDARPRTQRTPGLLPSWAPLPAPLNRSGCRATTSRIQPPGWPPPHCQLKQMHEDLLQHYDCTDQAAAAQPAPPSVQAAAAAAAQPAPPSVQAAALHAGANPQPQPAGSQDNGQGKFVLPQLNRLHEAFKRSQVSPPASSSQDQPTRPRPIPSDATEFSPSSSPRNGPAPALPTQVRPRRMIGW